MSAPATPGTDARLGARWMGAYARQYAAGAFATPTAAEVTKLSGRGGWHWWQGSSPDHGVAAASRLLTRDSLRADYTGRRYLLPRGSAVVTHLAASAGATLPDLSRFDFVHAYAEDANIAGQLRAQGRQPYAVRVSAASELITCWAHRGSGYRYPAVDRATLVELPLPPVDLERVEAEVRDLAGWHDDYPYYSDGSWAALSLRGFDPTDPTWGVKPAEMGKTWHAEHPEAAARTVCDWTTLAAAMPATVELIGAVAGEWGGLERVRLMRMAGRDGRGGALSRHSDVTDRDSGTHDGQIIRFHVPILTAPQVTTTAWNLDGRAVEVHQPAGTLWYLDARKPHAVANRSGADRVHLCIDVVANAAARAAIVAGVDHAA